MNYVLLSYVHTRRHTHVCNLKSAVSCLGFCLCLLLSFPHSTAQAQERTASSFSASSLEKNEARTETKTFAQEDDDFSRQSRYRDFRLSFFGGLSARTILGNSDRKANVGVRFGVQVNEYIYLGARASLHPYTYGREPRQLGGGMPLLLGAETGYEFRLSPTMFLKPYVGLGYYGVDETYIGYGNIRYSPEYPSFTALFGVIYSIEVAPYLLVGLELSLVTRASSDYLNLHVGYRF
jgi:hypothetical protein